MTPEEHFQNPKPKFQVLLPDLTLGNICRRRLDILFVKIQFLPEIDHKSYTTTTEIVAAAAFWNDHGALKKSLTRFSASFKNFAAAAATISVHFVLVTQKDVYYVLVCLVALKFKYFKNKYFQNTKFRPI